LWKTLPDTTRSKEERVYSIHVHGIRPLTIVIVACVAATGCAASLGKELKKAGYNELRPASDLVTPGTLITIQSTAGPAVVVDRICDKTTAYGEMAAVHEATGASTSLTQKLTRGFSLKADEIASGASAGGNLTQVRDITLTLRNVKLLEMDGDQAVAGRPHRSTPCDRAVQQAEQGGQAVTMIKRAIQADAEYSVNFKDSASLSAETKRAIVSSIAGSLGAKFESEGERVVKGTGLVWGIFDDSIWVFPKGLPTGFSAATVKAKPQPKLPTAAAVQVRDRLARQ
jgi:hypothetical protein